jgi:hypothetical protein
MLIGTTRLKKALAAAETTCDILNPEDKLSGRTICVAFRIQHDNIIVNPEETTVEFIGSLHRTSCFVT